MYARWPSDSHSPYMGDVTSADQIASIIIVLSMSLQLTKFHSHCTGDVTSADQIASIVFVLVMSLQLTKLHPVIGLLMSLQMTKLQMTK